MQAEALVMKDLLLTIMLAVVLVSDDHLEWVSPEEARPHLALPSLSLTFLLQTVGESSLISTSHCFDAIP